MVERTTTACSKAVEQAVVTYNSDAYQPARSVLGDGAQRDIRIIEAAD